MIRGGRSKLSPAGRALGFAQVPVELDLAAAKDALGDDAKFEYRVVTLSEDNRVGTDWRPSKEECKTTTGWRRCA